MQGLSRRFAAALLAGLLLSWPAAAADRAMKASEYYEDALVRLNRNDTKGAIIQLKNALQQDSKNLPALVLLGKAYLKAGQPLGADRVLADAERIGADRTELIATQVEVYHLLGRNQALLDRFSPAGLPPAIRYKVLVARAYAQIDLGKETDAVQSLDQAMQIDPNNPAALVAQSLAHLRRGSFPEAQKLALAAIAKNPADPAAWNMKASIAHAQGDLKDALVGYTKALALQPDYLDALIARASLLLDLNRDADAGRDVALLKAKFSDDPRASYLQALLAGRQGKDIEARNALTAAASTLDALPYEAVLVHPQLILLGAVSHFSLGQDEKAKTYLGSYLKQFPHHMGARKIYTAILLKEKDYAGAIAFLEGPARATPDDPQALSMLATAYMVLKQHSKAVSLLEAATRLSGGTVPDITTNFGLSLIGSGQTDVGLAQLKKAYTKVPGDGRAGVPLAIMYLKQQQTGMATQVLLAVMKNEPDNLTALNLLGIARGLSGDRAGARKTYEQVLAKDGRFTSATLNLARLDQYEGKAADARHRLLAILADQPRNLDAQIELGQVELDAGHPQDAIRWLEKARSFNPQSLRPTLMLVELYLGAGDAQKALDAAKDAQAGHRDNLQALATLGRAYQAAGNQDMARQNFRRITQVAGFDADWQQRAAQLQIGVGDYEGARYSLDKSLLSKPDYFPALLSKAILEKASGNLDAAEQQARALAERQPREAAVQQLLGDIALQRQRFSDAIAAYRRAYSQEKNAERAIVLYNAYRRSGNTAMALGFAKSWAQSSPSDRTAQRVLAEAYLAGGRYQDARRAYERVLSQDNNDPVSLNNLANALLQLGDAGALNMAERAYKAAPQDPNACDTLGLALLRTRQAERALKYLRDARVRAPGNLEIREHLAQALEATGRVDEAQIERATTASLRAPR